MSKNFPGNIHPKERASWKDPGWVRQHRKLIRRELRKLGQMIDTHTAYHRLPKGGPYER